ncbi:amino-acid N-acetyltransferase [Thiohalobacter sp.]|uniref:amino-acid N-acetyltransferase n=1 Tax=Thiohalobacter sp. TaxID=2025948 RepID=UPI0026203BDC|nr:amino-acid N-acetyltransferase [Thiohalobacter sp.]
MNRKQPACSFVEAFRHSAPYIHAHRGRTFVVSFTGEAVADDESFPALTHDIALLHSLGIRLVLVHGARPQIERRLQQRGIELQYANGLRITDDAALECVKEAVGTVRVEIEARLTTSMAASPRPGLRLGVSSGNFVTARPLGIRDGIDYCHTGEVRRIDGEAIREELARQRIVLLSPLGYSPTGEVFNLHAEEVATAAATELRADKLILLVEGRGLLDGRRRLIRQLDPAGAEAVLAGRRRLDEDMRRHLESGLTALKRGVRRVHLVGRAVDGALLQELFTRDGAGTLVTAETYEGLRQAGIDDVGGILELIEPLEAEGVLVRRSRELLEMEIDRFMVMERDGMIIACAALYPFGKVGELACLAVHPDYRSEGRGDQLLEAIERRARQQGIQRLFVLTTRAAHWFQERGFRRGEVGDLPVRRRSLYNYQRNARVLIKPLDGAR